MHIAVATYALRSRWLLTSSGAMCDRVGGAEPDFPNLKKGQTNAKDKDAD